MFGVGGRFEGGLPQILAVFTSTINTISDGMQYGWTAPIIPLLEREDTPVPIQKFDVVWLENIYMIGGLIGLPITIYLVDKVGRKNSILIACVQNLIAWILIATASSVEVLYLGRFITGVAADVAFVSAPMYIAEIADHRIRGFLGSFIYLMMLVGILIIYSVGPFVSVLMSSMVGVIIVVLQLLTFPFMPKSPYYLLLKGKKDDARKALRILRATENVEIELEEISEAVERQSSEKGRPIDLITVESNRKALLIVLVLNCAQHFSGISVFFMNIHTILNDSVLPSNAAAIIFAVIMLVAGCTAACIMDKIGRKILLSSSSLLTGVSLVVLASYFAVKHAGIDISAYNWIPIAAIMLYGAVFKYGLGLVPIVLTGELYPTSVKAMAMTMGDVSYVSFSVISIYLYQYLTDNFGIHVPFFIFAVSCLLSTVFIILYIPETKGRTLEEIQLILKGQKLDLNPKRCKSDMDGKVNGAMEDTVF